MIIQDKSFACNLTVLREGEREQFVSVTESLFAAVQESHELENGFAFRFLNQPDQLTQIAQFIEREGQCCPFLKFTLEVEPFSGPVWMRITGEPGVKEFLSAELDQFRNTERA